MSTNKPPRDAALDEFIAEGKEILQRVTANLQAVEQANATTGAGSSATDASVSKEQIAALYRDMHTLKGSSQLFGFQLMGQVAHAMEASLDPIRKSDSKVTPQLVDACLKNIDLLEKMLRGVDESGSDKVDQNEMTRVVSELIEAATARVQANFKLAKDVLYSENKGQGKESFAARANLVESKTKGASAESNTATLAENAPSPKVASLASAKPNILTNEKVREQNMSTYEHTTQASSGSPTVQNAAQNDPRSGSATAGASASNSSAQESTIRVHVSLLDRILNLVGELVLVRNQLLQYRASVDNPDFINTSKSLDVVTSELQSEVMKTRMQPIEAVVGKFQRLVRDISRDLNKKIDLTLEGSETELDKSLLEAVKDPLTHIVRNSCDHGIETPEDRRAANKPETGHMLIRAYHEGGQVVIEVSDDGRGLNRKKILAKAMEKNLITQERAAKMSDREICEIIFMAGFSTAQQVTSVSGRGVGMDVVKTNIEKIGGSVELSSVEGKNTTIRLRIPLTLAIVPALVIQSGKDKFAIPQVKLVELVRVGGDSASGQIEYLQGRPMFRLRGSLLPLFDVREITGEKFDRVYKGETYIVVLNSDGERFGLLVSEILDTADIVVKPLSSFLKHLTTFSGATILGDGNIALILDVSGVAQFGKVLNKRASKDDREHFSSLEKKKSAMDVQEFLLFSVGMDAVHAVPLCLVQRLEEFSGSLVEKSGEQQIVRYRDALLPLINLKTTLKYKSKKGVPEDDYENIDPNVRIPVIVVQRSGRSYGIVVNEILDVVTIEGQIDDAIRDRVGILGNIVHDQEVVVIIDALGIIERFASSLTQGARAELKIATKASADSLDELRSRNRELKSKKIRVLYAEDVAFFRKHVSKVLNEAGFDVTTFEDGQKALQELETVPADQYNLILSDIEMPNMNGLDLVRQIRSKEKLKNLPVIALTTRFRDKDIEDGRAAGFDFYLEKLNPEKLLEAVSKVMAVSRQELGANV